MTNPQRRHHLLRRLVRRIPGTGFAGLASVVLFCAGCAGGSGSVHYMSGGLSKALTVDAQLQDSVAEYTFVNQTDDDLYVQYSLDGGTDRGRWYRVHLMPRDEARVRHAVGEQTTDTPRVSVRSD